MNQLDVLRPPITPQPRETSLNIRLTKAERKAIDSLAQQMNATPSHMARHFLLRIVAYYAKQGEQK